MVQSLLDIVHCINSSDGILIGAEAHEAEATATTGITVLDNNLWITVRLKLRTRIEADLTASSTGPNSENFVLRAASSVCQERPLQ